MIRFKHDIFEGARSTLNEAPRDLEQVCVGGNKTAYLVELVPLQEERLVVGRGRGTLSVVGSRGCVIPVLATSGARVGVQSGHMLAEVSHDFLAHGTIAGDDLAQNWFPPAGMILCGAVANQVQGVGRARPACRRPRSRMRLSRGRLDVVPRGPWRLGRGRRDNTSAWAGTGATAIIMCTCRGGPRAGVVEAPTVATDGGASAGRGVLGNLGLEVGLDRRAIETGDGRAESAVARSSRDGRRCGNDRQQISVARIRDAAGLILMGAWGGALSPATRADGRNGFASVGVDRTPQWRWQTRCNSDDANEKGG